MQDQAPPDVRSVDPLRESEERYRTLVEMSPDAIGVHRDGRFAYANAATARLLGARLPDELIGRSLLSFVHPDYQQLASDRLRRVTEEGVAVPYVELKIVRLDGRSLDVEVATAPITFEGRPAALSVARDVTERRRIAEELERSLSLHRATLDSTADGLLVVDTEGRIADYNRRFPEMWHIPLEVLSSRDDREALTWVLEQLVEPERFLSKVQELYARRDAVSFDTLEFKDGRIFERYSMPQRLGNRIIGRVWSFRDVTDRERLGREVTRLQKMDAIGRLASGVAHDFNNLLSVVRSYTDLVLSDTEAGDVHRDDLEQIRHATERASTLARQLLVFARRQPSEPRPLDLSRLVVELRPILERLVRGDIRIAFSTAPGLHTVVTDAAHVERVLINLVMNAVDALPRGGAIAITLRNIELDDEYVASHPAARTGAYVELAVSDSGIGMDEATLSRIFEPFFTTKPPGEGTGLGLVTVYSIMEQNGGHVDVRSRAGVGSTFRLFFPAAPAGS